MIRAVFAPVLAWCLPLLLASAPAQAQELAWPDEDFESRVFEAVMTELYVAEQQEFYAYYANLDVDGRVALLDLADRLPDGNRGPLVLYLLQMEEVERQSFLAFLIYLGPDTRQMLADNAMAKQDLRWDVLGAFASQVAPEEAAWALFRADRLSNCDEADYPGEAAIGIAGDGSEHTYCPAATEQFLTDWNTSVDEMINPDTAVWGAAPFHAQLVYSASALSRKPVTSDEVLAFGPTPPDWARRHICGGVYIGDQSVLTAAHCISGWTLEQLRDQMSVRLGTISAQAGGQELDIVAAVMHADYTGGNSSFRNDIALLRLGEAVDSDSIARAVPVSSPSRENIFQVALQLTGYGYTGKTYDTSQSRDVSDQPQRYTRFLQIGELHQRSSDSCGNEGQLPVLDGQICAGSDEGVDACRGDSGGPLVVGGSRRLVGLVSYGAGCGLENSSKIYVDVGYYRRWIGRAKRCAAHSSEEPVEDREVIFLRNPSGFGSSC